MDFAPIDLDEEVIDFWQECASFFDEHVTDEVRLRERREGGGFDEALHLAMGKRGWVAPAWPKGEGGADLDELHARIVEVERTRAEAPMVLASTTLLPPIAIRMFASDEIKEEVLRGVADGTIRISLGYTEPDCGSDLAAVRTRAVRDGDEWVISGQKMFTTGAQFCQYCFCLTRTNPDVAKHKGLTVFLVPLGLPGIDVRPIDTLGGERTNFVHFDDVRVPDRYRLGDVDQGWSVVSAPLAAEHAMVAKDDDGSTNPYLATRRRLIDEVVKHLPDRALEDPVVRERLARAELDHAAACAAPNMFRRIVAADGLVRCASDLTELLGPTAVLGAESGGSAVEYGFRYALGTTIYGGSTDIQRNLIAEGVLGLPRSTPRR